MSELKDCKTIDEIDFASKPLSPGHIGTYPVNVGSPTRLRYGSGRDVQSNESSKLPHT